MESFQQSVENRAKESWRRREMWNMRRRGVDGVEVVACDNGRC